MYYVDIRIPELAKTGDFMLEEETKTTVIIKQLTSIVFGQEREVLLFDLTEKKQLFRELSLKAQGVRGGHTLLLLSMKASDNKEHF